MAETASPGIRAPYVVTTIVLVAVGIPLGIVVAGASIVTVKVVEGFTAFAILYVLAQAIERFNQILVPLLDKLLAKLSGKPTSSDKKEQGIIAVRSGNAQTRSLLATGGESLMAQAVVTATAEKIVTEANIEKSLLTNALAFFLAILAVGFFKFSLLGSIGFEGVPPWLDWVITSTAIMGGSAGLGDLISKIQKSKTKDELTT